MRFKRKKGIIAILLSVVIVISFIVIYLVWNTSNNNSSDSTIINSNEYQRTTILASGHVFRPCKTAFKTRDGGTEDSRIVVSLDKPLSKRQFETFKIDIYDIDNDDTQSVLSVQIKEGETLYIDNNLKAGKYYDLGVSKLDPNDTTMEYDIAINWQPDESTLDIPRSYIG